MKKENFSIPKMACNHCAQTIQDCLAQLEGIQEITFDVPHKQVTLTYEAPLELTDFNRALAETHYQLVINSQAT